MGRVLLWTFECINNRSGPLIRRGENHARLPKIEYYTHISQREQIPSEAQAVPTGCAGAPDRVTGSMYAPP